MSRRVNASTPARRSKARTRAWPAAAIGLASSLCTAAPASAEETSPAQSAVEPDSTVSGMLSVTPQFRRLYDIPVHAIELGVGVSGHDAADRPAHAYVAAHLLFGETSAGLAVVRGALDAVVDFRLGRFAHAGCVAGVGYLAVSRATRGSMTNLTLVGELFVGPELRFADVALSLDAALLADYVPGTDHALLWGAGAAVRGRFY